MQESRDRFEGRGNQWPLDHLAWFHVCFSFGPKGVRRVEIYAEGGPFDRVDRLPLNPPGTSRTKCISIYTRSGQLERAPGSYRDLFFSPSVTPQTLCFSPQSLRFNLLLSTPRQTQTVLSCRTRPAICARALAIPRSRGTLPSTRRLSLPPSCRTSRPIGLLLFSDD